MTKKILQVLLLLCMFHIANISSQTTQNLKKSHRNAIQTNLQIGLDTLREIIEICVNFNPEIIEAGDLESAQSALATLKEISANLIEYYTRLLEAFDEEVVNSDEVLWNFDEIVYDVNTVLETKTKKMLRNFNAFTVLRISEKLGVVLPDVIKVWRDIVETVDKIASRNNNIKSSAKHLIKQLIELNEFIAEIKSATNPIILLNEYSTELRAILMKELKEYEKIINKSMAEAHGCLTIMSNDYTLREKVDQIRIEKSFANFMDFYSKKVGFMNKDELQLQEYKEMALNSLQKLTRHFEGYVQEITEIVIENFLHNFQSITKEILNDSDMYSNLYQSSDIKRTYFCYAIKIPAAISAQYDQYLSILTKLFNPKTCDVTQQQSIKIFEIFDKKMFELGKELITGNYSKKILNMILKRIPDLTQELDEVSHKIIKITEDYKNNLRNKLTSLPKMQFMDEGCILSRTIQSK